MLRLVIAETNYGLAPFNQARIEESADDNPYHDVGNVLARYMISHMGIPPLFYASMRYLIAAAALAHLIWPMPRPRGPLIAGTLLLGVFSFGLFYIALQTVNASSASVVGLSQSPMGILLAMSLLGERASLQRIVGIVLTFLGVALDRKSVV